MRILDEFDNVIEHIDETKGYLKNDRLFVCHHAPIEAVEEQGHWETIAEYPNGGKDVDWIIDVPGIEAKEAWDEYEDVLRYILFDKKELAELKINELKRKLSETDYNILKIVEGAATLTEMAGIISQRSKWRAEINELEKDLT